jgi:hypothetical protein
MRHNWDKRFVLNVLNVLNFFSRLAGMGSNFVVWCTAFHRGVRNVDGDDR